MFNFKKVFFTKPVLLGTAAVALIGTIFYFQQKTEAKPSEILVTSDYAKYISAFTTGLVSSEEKIRIVLAQNALDSVKIGEPGAESLFDFSPEVKGTATWLDQYTVEFTPSKKMDSDVSYEVDFNLSKVADVKEEELKHFKFGFRVIKQDYEVKYEGLRCGNEKEPATMGYVGQLWTSDVANAEEVEKMLEANYAGESKKIQWTHDASQKVHAYHVQDLHRGDKTETLTLKWNGDALGVDKEEEKKVEVPAAGVFRFLEAIVTQTPEQYITLVFSDPLNKAKDLNGLLLLNGNVLSKYIIEGNIIKLYPSTRASESATLSISGIENYQGEKLASFTLTLNFELPKPSVRLIGNGVIVPNTNGSTLFPFEAVGLKAVDITVTKIFENNVVQFLLGSNLDNQADWRVGRPILNKTIFLETGKSSDYTQWKRYYLDLGELIKTEPGAVYQISLRIKKKHAAYPCKAEEEEQSIFSFGEEEDTYEKMENAFEKGEYYYGYESYEYAKREDPCEDSYYAYFNNQNGETCTRNVLASDLGIISKIGKNEEVVTVVSDLKTAKPLEGVDIVLYDAQQQLIGTAKTDNEGIAKTIVKRKPFVLVAKSGSQRGYLKLNEGSSLSLSSFDVSGGETQKGLKGFLYGERGVWRPGDSLYVTFVLEDKVQTLPKNHPIVFSLYNPQRQVVKRMTQLFSEGNMYTFRTLTDPTDPTGEWLAEVKLGGAVFNKTIRIETVKPNRLKLALDFGKNKLTALDEETQGKLHVQWLTGANAAGLKATYEAFLSTGKTVFDNFRDYIFDDPMANFSPQTQTVYDGALDGNGDAVVNASFDLGDAHAPGALNVTFKGKVFEQGGDFSVDNFTMPYFPYTSFVGILPPATKSEWDYLYTDQNHTVHIATVDAEGKSISRQGVQLQLFKLDWRWWWEQEGGENEYENSESMNLVTSGVVNTAANGQGKWVFSVNGDHWGRYYLKATDPVSGHTTGKIVYIDSPYGNHTSASGGLTRLQFFPDKEKYQVGDKVKLTFPSNATGKAFVSLENGSRVLKTFWVDGKEEKTEVEFEATREMSPNIFAHIHFVQPHAQTSNDLPIRLYGVCPVVVEDSKTKLEPVISMPDVLRPEENVTITVSEKANKAMAYTIAVVDEGLLDLTRFKTPDPWKYFYAKEALGVRTWDMYDLVLGSLEGNIERLLSIGGDGEIHPSKNEDKGNSLRFKPVVKFLGPFYSDGKSRSHTFKMPNYVGSVRTMVVAANMEAAYGATEKTTAVKNPLMVLATLPRVLGPEEELKLPVNVFALEGSVKNVSISVKTNDLLTLVGSTTATASFSKPGDQLVTFNLKVKPKLGQGKVIVTAISGSNRATQEIDIKVRVPNPYVSSVVEQIIEPGRSWSGDYVPTGMAGTNTGTLEVSVIPPINLEQRMSYLVQYPHGCIEQTTSSVFPQLYLSDLVQLDEAKKAMIQNNITAGIRRLQNFQTSDGGFSYWPGESEPSEWGTNYAGHFLLEAQAKGYKVPSEMLSKWAEFQKQRTQMPRSREYDWQGLELTYRLYTLALAGKSDFSAMNRLKDAGNLSTSASWRLAAAYTLAGQSKVAQEIIKGLPIQVPDYKELAYTYGSDERDEAMILETMILMGERVNSVSLLMEISKALSNPYDWMSTQTTAYCLLAVSKYVGIQKENKGLQFRYTFPTSGSKQVSTALPLSQLPIPNANANSRVTVLNPNASILYARIVSEGVPLMGDPTEVETNLKMSIVYKTMKGKVLDVSAIPQGTDFMAEVTLTNPGTRGEYKQMALTQIFPSGWEISNTRMDGTSQFYASSLFDYQDVRDDRVYTYFNLESGKTKTFRILLNAAYTGKFYLPSTFCEAMYDHTIYSRKPGRWVLVGKGGSIN